MRLAESEPILEAVSVSKSNQISIAPFEAFLKAEHGNALVSRSESPKIAFLPTSAPAKSDFEFGKWHEGVRAFESFSRTQQRAWDRDAVELKARMQVLESRTHAQLVELSKKVDLLTVAVSTATGFTGNNALSRAPDGAKDEAQVRQIVTGSEALADQLDCVADGELTPSEAWRDQAISSLSDADPVVRSAAGRALCVLDPVMAAEVLPARIALEQNRVVASVLKGALRALS